MKRFFGIAIYVAIVCLTIPSLSFSQAIVSIDPATMESPPAGEQFEIRINISDATNVLGYQVSVVFDLTALSFVHPNPDNAYNGDFLPAGAFAVPVKVEGDKVTLSATSLSGPANGAGTLAIITFEVIEPKDSTIALVDVLLSDPNAQPLDVTTQDGTITGPPVNEPPVAAITASTTEAEVGETITFSGANSTDDNGIVNYSWDFGDGVTAEGETVDHAYDTAGDYTVILTVTDDGNPPLTDEDSIVISIEEPEVLDDVITEPRGGFLALTAEITEASTPAKCYIALWEGEMDAEAGTFFEYQVKFSMMSVHKKGGVFAHTAEGNVIGLDGVDDGTEEWLHRQVSLDGIAGQKIVAITVGTDNGESPENPAGPFRMMIDNVQITNGTGILTKVWVDQESINGQKEVTDLYGDAGGVDNPKVDVSLAVSVTPKGKKITTLGEVKSAR